MSFIGETNYCALVLDDSAFQNWDKSTLFCRKPLEASYSVVALVIRVTVQLSQLGIEFQKKENTRIIPQLNVVLHFYLHKNNFYMAMTGCSSFICETTTLADILQNVVQDISLPLYKKLEICSRNKAYLEYTDTDAVFEVEEDEEPVYKRRRTVSV